MSFFEKGLLLYLFLIIGCVFWSPGTVLTDAQGRNPLEMFGIQRANFYQNDSNDVFSYNMTNVQTNFDDPLLNTEATIGNETDQTMFKRGKLFSSGFQWVVDGLSNVMGLVTVLFKILFSPFIVFGQLVSLGAPSALIFLFAIPLVFALFIGFVMFIRGII